MDLVCFRNAPRVRARLRQLGHVPEHLLDELTADVIARALSASFDQSTPGQFFSWLDTIVKRTRADFFRAPKQRTGLDAEGLAEEHEGEDDFRLAQGWEDFPYDRVEAADVVQRALDSLENDMPPWLVVVLPPGIRPRGPCGSVAGRGRCFGSGLMAVTAT